MTVDASTLTPWGLLPLRVALGLVFVAHGGQKLAILGIAGTATFMREAGIPLPVVAAVLVTSVELLGGLGLIVGLWGRLAASLLAVDMLVALLVVQARAGLLRPGGFEFVLVLLGGCLTIALTGPGRPALTRPFRSR